MKAVILAPLVLAGSACATMPIEPAGAEAELRALEIQWAQARVDNDTVFLERFYAPELKLQNNDGSVIAREDDIALFAAHRIKPEYIHDTDIRVMVYGDSAVMTGIESLKGTYNGHPGEMSLRFTNVFIHRDGRWQLAAHQSTTIAAK